jgi:uncharacterized protein YeaO (DUF488 family)
MIKVKRIYEPASDDDGFRVLVDRLWPRGVSNADARIDLWLLEIAPSDALRKWYKHDPEKWEEFKTRYFAELDQHTELLDPILNRPGHDVMTFLFSSKELKLNNAYALKAYLETMQ